jgi:hypothetical protein
MSANGIQAEQYFLMCLFVPPNRSGVVWNHGRMSTSEEPDRAVARYRVWVTAKWMWVAWGIGITVTAAFAFLLSTNPDTTDIVFASMYGLLVISQISGILRLRAWRDFVMGPQGLGVVEKDGSPRLQAWEGVAAIVVRRRSVTEFTVVRTGPGKGSKKFSWEVDADPTVLAISLRGIAPANVRVEAPTA